MVVTANGTAVARLMRAKAMPYPVGRPPTRDRRTSTAAVIAVVEKKSGPWYQTCATYWSSGVRSSTDRAAAGYPRPRKMSRISV